MERKIYKELLDWKDNNKSQSLKSYIDIFKPKQAFKISLNNINVSNKTMKAIPHYVFVLLTIQELTSL